jgi:hypothetical protein
MASSPSLKAGKFKTVTLIKIKNFELGAGGSRL